MKCLICNTRRATSTHHVRPRDNSGPDDHKSKIMLCRPCYDIAEETCNDTGVELGPHVVELIRLEYGFPTSDASKDIDRSVFATSLYRLRRKYRSIKRRSVKSMVPGTVVIRCPYCGKWHSPEKNGRVICPALKREIVQIKEANVFHNTLMENIKRIRALIE